MQADPQSSAISYEACLDRWALSLNFSSDLSKISLANVLAADTCEPISLRDFEHYLEYREHSIENLHFIVWYQDYRNRYLKWLEEPQSSKSRFKISNLLRTFPKAGAAGPPMPQISPSLSGIMPTDTSPASPVAPSSEHYPVDSSSTPQISTSPSSQTPNRPRDSQQSPSTAENLRYECMAAVATFFQPQAPQQLSIDSTLRDEMLTKLATDMHPDIFSPAYDETYHLLEHGSLQRFLSIATANINLPKQLYWYAVGVIDTILSIAISLSLILNGHTPHRAWRLFSVVFMALGSGQLYSAWRGFCSEVFRRDATQLQSWELVPFDEESGMFSGSLNGRSTPPPPESVSTAVKKARDIRLDVAPFADSSSDDPNGSHDSHRLPRPNPQLKRPPIFGPERLVLDPNVKAVHRRVMRDIYAFAVIVTLAYSALIFSVPSR